MARKVKPKIDRKAWRDLPYADWNTATALQMFVDLNREYYEADYVPMRNWAFERGIIMRELERHGAEVLRLAIEECFRSYRPTREYPILTAGFAIAYRINSVIPKIREEMKRTAADITRETADYDAVQAWL